LHLWPLTLVGLSVLLYGVINTPTTGWRLFATNTATLSIFTLWASAGTLMHLELENRAFASLARLSSLPLALGVAVSLAAALVLYRRFRGPSLLLNSLWAGSLMSMLESLFQHIFGGYYFAAFAHLLVDAPLALPVASVLGMHGVTFVAVAGGAFVAELCAAQLSPLRTGLAGVYAAVAVASIYGLAAALPAVSAGATLAVGLVQPAYHQGYLSTLEAAAPALEAPTELVVYPNFYTSLEHVGNGAPLSSAAAQQRMLSQLARAAQPAQTVVVWSTIESGGRLTNPFQFIRNGAVVASYEKQRLFPFSDYDPAWVRSLGHEVRAKEVSPSVTPNPFRAEGLTVGGLSCSEVHDQSYTREIAPDSQFLLAIGSDANVPGAAAGNYSLAGARYRAAENGRPVVRSSRYGPSALIGARGEIINHLSYGHRGTLVGTLPLGRRVTPFAQFGTLPLLAIGALVLCGVICQRRHGGHVL
jgi:apolipoprotein N-acyltransferase